MKDACNDDNIRIYSKATEQTLIPLTEGIEQSIYVWLVYTDNTGGDTDTGNKVDAAYTAHYVSCEGEYLNSIPVTDIGNKEALSGSTAAFAFKNMENGEQ